MEPRTCAHPGCGCEAAPDGYCSAYCAAAKADGRECECGHPPCRATRNGAG